LLAALCLGTAAGASEQAQTLDRVVASVGKVAITESDVLDEYRLERFLEDGREPSDRPGPQEMEKIRGRLIDQKLLEFEAGQSTLLAGPSEEVARKRLAILERQFPNEEAFEVALQPLGITKQQLFEKLVWQERILRVVDHRLRPVAVVKSKEIKDYYQQTLVPQLAQSGNRNPPPLPEVEAKIHELLVQQKIDQLLKRWLSQLKTSQHVELMSL